MKKIPLKSQPIDSVLSQKLEKWIPRLDDNMPGNLYQTVMQSVERPLIEYVLDHTGGNQVKAANLLGINRNTLRTKINKLGIS